MENENVADVVLDRRGYRKTGRVNRRREKPARTQILEHVLAHPADVHETRTLKPVLGENTKNDSLHTAVYILVKEGFLVKTGARKYTATGKTLVLAWFYRNPASRVTRGELMQHLQMDEDEADDVQMLLDTLVHEQEIYCGNGAYRLELVEAT